MINMMDRMKLEALREERRSIGRDIRMGNIPQEEEGKPKCFVEKWPA